ncbi:MAG: glycosyltransferase family 4 protein [Candidatus Eremiobacteraeota bacterium]|nr:glycosyltransferase family 4 protein [Candidatus Eremiobacteraeota bacterium]
MKVALISAKFPFGPKEPYLEAEINALSEYIEELTIIPTSPPRRKPRAADLPAWIVRKPLFSFGTFAAAVRMCFADPKAVGEAWRSIVAPRMRFLVKLKNIAVFPKALAVAEIVKREGVDHIHSYWLSTPSTVAYVAAQIAKKPWSSTAHRWDIYENNLALQKADSASFIRIISRRGLTDFRKRIQRTHWERSIVLHLGVNVPPNRAAASIEARNRPLTLLCAAALIPIKGHEVLLEALCRIRDTGVSVRCVLAGEGPLRKRIGALIRELDLSSSVTMLSEVPHPVLLRQIQSGVYDAVVLPSLERRGGHMEGIPVALMEAMAAGLPCIATDSGSITELLDASCGIVVPNGDSIALAKAITTLAADPTRGADLGERGRQRIEEQYNARHTAAVLSALLRRPAMLEEHAPALVSAEA